MGNKTNIVSSVVFVTILLGLFNVGSCQEPSCCDQVGGSCANACRQLSLAALDAESPNGREKLLRPLQLSCPSQLTSFWECMNETTTALLEGAQWEGRLCCSKAQTRLCQISCWTAQRSSDLGTSHCRRSDETTFYHCLEKQEAHSECCGQSKKPECGTACRNYLRESPLQTRRHGLKKRLNVECAREQAVLSCVANLTLSKPIQNPERNLPCCSRGRSLECQEACKRALKSASSDIAMFEMLVERGCGHPRPDDKMWQCFLQNAEPRGTELPSKIDRLGMDAAKLHCCHRARNPTCRRLCHKTYSREWTGSWADYDRMCLSASNEQDLRDCVEEVDEPCELGCDGLSFCSAFNNRPSELFRRCNPVADLAAHQQFEQWKSLGYIPFMDMKLPLKDLSQCATEKWKAVACALQLRPCNPHNHASLICRSDCASLLQECVNLDALHMMPGSQDVTSICSLLSPPPSKPCISISHYIQPRANKWKQEQEQHHQLIIHEGKNHKHNQKQQQSMMMQPQITRPCRSRPCNTTETCDVNRKCSTSPGSNCDSYKCTVGCSLGEVSRLIVPPSTWIRVPSQGNPPGCQRLCRCGEDGRMEDCTTTICEPPSPCWLGMNRFDHGTHFWLDCNLCSCRGGELTCSKRQCTPPVESRSYLFTSSVSRTEVDLPCNCPPLRIPVCGANGRTYPSACLAKCGGLTDAEIYSGECSARDPCEGVSCGNGRRCIRTKRLCLIPLGRRCPQFQCVPLKCTEEPWHKSSQPVCDTTGREHRNLCHLSTSGATLAYSGPCLVHGCSSTTSSSTSTSQKGSEKDIVCGIDGESYPSKCAAEAQGIPIDYDGPCRFIGTGDGTSFENACGNQVECPRLPPHCMGVTPSGSCCPVCGGVLRVIYSPTQVLRLAESTDSQLITTEEISNRLNSLIQTAQCRAGVYLGLGTELIVIVTPVLKSWSRVQLQACISESERLGAFITQQNPIIQVDASLSVLTAAATNHVSSGVADLSSIFSSFKINLVFTLVSILILRKLQCC